MIADEQQPIACTLSGEARQDRLAWIVERWPIYAARSVSTSSLTLSGQAAAKSVRPTKAAAAA